jgi:hypothetical protein
MEPISNTALLVRILSSVVIVGGVGLVCGYLGPLYLLTDPGVGPLTALFTAPIGVAIGVAVAVWSAIAGISGRKYVYCLVTAAVVFAVATLVLVVVQ